MPISHSLVPARPCFLSGQVFLNDEPFTEHFKKHTRAITKAPVYYGQVDPEEWNLPPWIDRPLAEKKWSDMQKAHMIYGGSESYRKMCR